MEPLEHTLISAIMLVSTNLLRLFFSFSAYPSFLPASAPFSIPTTTLHPPDPPSTLHFVMKSLICWIPRKADYAYFSFGQREMEPGVWQQRSVQV